MKELLSQLNEQQLQAVTYLDGPLVIFAGAGTGKTRVITYRIAYLLNIGVSPYNILAITFTNKAAEEMKNRVVKLVPQKGEEVWISTFHSFCAKFLYQEAENLGIKKNFVIYDESDSQKVIRECIKELSLEDVKIPISYIYQTICRAKENLIDAESYKIYSLVSFENPLREYISEIYFRYQKKLKNYNAFDFGDLIMKTVEFLKDTDFKEIKEKYANRFRYIHVDEYQDVNFSEVSLLKILSSKHYNVCVVGDDDQSIYSWRGSDVNYLLNFKKDFSLGGKKVKEFKLEKNYRSKKSILEVANFLISNNKNRVHKTLFSDIEGDVKTDIKIQEFSDEYEEAKFVASEIKKLFKTKEYKDSNISVFYRTNSQSRIFEEVFKEEGIPYKIVGALAFYERQEIKDILSYLRILINPEDSLSLKRVINIPPRGIGETTILYLETLSKEQKTSLWQQILNIDNTDLNLKIKNAIWKFLSLYDILKKQKDSVYPSEFIEFLIEKTGYLKMIEESYDSETKFDKIENIKELINVAKNYEINQNITTIEEFLAKLSLITTYETEKKSCYLDNSNKIVSLMTLHSAKGLEFDVVFIVGLEEDIFPAKWAIKKIQNSYNFEENNELSLSVEEERRLCYVGITRAKKRVYLTYSLTKNINGAIVSVKPSRFIEEILRFYDKKLFNIEDLKINNLKSIDFEVSNESFKAGDYVLHDKFGFGKILEVIKEPNSEKVVVFFQDGNKRKLDLQYTSLKKIKEFRNVKDN